MAFVIKDRVKETTTTTGTGTLTLDGAATGFETFSGALGNTNTTYYAIASQNSGDFEVGIGTVGAGTLSRDTVISSSNSDALVNFTSGTKDVFVTLPASKTILLNDSDTVDLTGNLDLNSNDITGTGNINITGNLTASGNLTSLGIDDNATSTAITIDSSQKVGIANTIPGSFNSSANQLVVGSGSGQNGITIYSGTSNNGSIHFGDGTGASSYRGSINYYHNGDTLGFNVGASERMRLTSTGVGIGTSSPTYRLDVVGGTNTAKFKGRIVNIDGAAASDSPRVNLSLDSTDKAQLLLHRTSDDLQLGTLVNSDSIFITNNTERMRLTSTGLGIGTSSPDELLTVALSGSTGTYFEAGGTTDNSNARRLRFTSSTTTGAGDTHTLNAESSTGNIAFATFNTERMRINSSGLGIGTNSPSAELHIYRGDGEGDANLLLETGTDSGSVEPGIYLKGYATNSEPSIYFGDRFAYPGAITYDNVDNHLHINTNGSERMRIDSSGNVGIGTTSPSQKLHVNGHIVGNSLNIPSNTSSPPSGVTIHKPANDTMAFRINSTEKMRLTSTGLGIGTTSPQQLINIQSTSNAKIRYAYSSTVYGEFGRKSNGVHEWSSYENGGDLSFGTTQVTGSTTERMRIEANGNVGIGNTVASTINSANGTGNLVVGSGSGTEGITIYSGTTGEGTLQFADASTGAGTYVGQINYNHSNNFMSFGVNGSEAFRFSLGGLIIGKTSGIITDTGNYFGGNNGNNMVRAGGTVCGFNREATDGIIIEFSGDGTVEGNISVSGTTVSYNGFTGTHWSRFIDNSTPNILRGTVLESLDEMCDWYNLEFDVVTQDENGNDITSSQKIPHVLADGQSDGNVITYNHEGTDYQATIVKETDVKHMMSKVSDTVDAKNVYGVFNAYDEDGEGYNDFYVASVGSFVVRIKQGETVAKGDLLQSNGDGTAKVQTDDAVRSSSFAKVLSTTIIETYDDGSYLVPCSLMC